MSPPPPPIRQALVCVLAAILIPACASSADDDAPGCSGARRPANPQGSLLAPGAAPPDAPPAGACRAVRP
ncbi:MAG: hypothetical protein GC203_12145 [Phenylobacterium sp.]|uniref:hypothetical protein n=1 Tax=Phenylobacterium sp. TaxID=1871053 RepID=UPI0025FD953D|nr:hypothetical protein [Phenylobacterium sp.]MBI1198606.1 hypothetical protein [Phenylobacterium sp.]